jgi:hypothetical protein
MKAGEALIEMQTNLLASPFFNFAILLTNAVTKNHLI